MMQYHVSGKMLEGVTIRPDIPKQYQHFQLPFATTVESVSGVFGAMLNQVVAGDDWSIQLVQFFIAKQVRLYPVAQQPLGVLHCMLKGQVPCMLKGMGDIVLRERELHFFYVPAGSRNLALLSKGYYESFQIGFSSAYLSRFAQNGSPLKEVYHKLAHQLPLGAAAGSCALSLQAIEQVEKIRQCQLKGTRRHLYHQARINDLMLMYISALEDRHHQKLPVMSKHETEMHQLSAYIKDNLEKPLMIAQLADKMGLQLQAMEKEFKKVHKQTVKSFVQEQRMKRARLLLADGKMQVTDVAYTVGYADAAYFSNAFKKQFGMTPSTYQKIIQEEKLQDNVS
ncbi:AraC family transcriptional regulator [uncultured Chitinophaga sp.]|jgi:AraC-type DNA-binding domain-containing proteins|uniref:helix-turn-helix transcriptional regulator n=1 Tax=uncultured Chitinophaga sp. TaxID=339340 RepID=UPI002605CF31|nr:AraC family transcriptional regulator [uncultured Chitinophaga sp.]